VKKIYHSYSEDDISTATGQQLISPDPKSSYFIGPFLDYDSVHVFKHKLDALVFLRAKLQDIREEEQKKTFQYDSELQLINTMLKELKNRQSDDQTKRIGRTFCTENKLNLTCDGYWDDFIPSSSAYWETWAQSFIELESERLYWDNRNEDDVDTQSLIEDDEGMDYIEENLMGGNIPDDIFDATFCDHLMMIIPFE